MFTSISKSLYSTRQTTRTTTSWKLISDFLFFCVNITAVPLWLHTLRTVAKFCENYHFLTSSRREARLDEKMGCNYYTPERHKRRLSGIHRLQQIYPSYSNQPFSQLRWFALSVGIYLVFIKYSQKQLKGNDRQTWRRQKQKSVKSHIIMINHTGYGLSETFLNNPSSSVFGHALAIFGATVTVYVFSILFFFRRTDFHLIISNITSKW